MKEEAAEAGQVQKIVEQSRTHPHTHTGMHIIVMRQSSWKSLYYVNIYIFKGCLNAHTQTHTHTPNVHNYTAICSLQVLHTDTNRNTFALFNFSHTETTTTTTYIMRYFYKLQFDEEEELEEAEEADKAIHLFMCLMCMYVTFMK